MELIKKFFRKLFPKKTNLDFATPIIAHRFFTEGVRGKVLLTGDYLLRDYSALAKNCEVYLLDIVDNPGIPGDKYFQQSLEFVPPIKELDFALLPEVIENVWNDRDALLNIRNALKEGGELRISLQLYDDDSLHYHIYSPASIQLLLNHSGFEIISMRYHGFAVFLFHPYFIAVTATILYPIFQSRALGKVNSWVVKLNDLCSSSWLINKWFYPSVYIKARPNEIVVNSVEEQKKFYEEHSQQRSKL